MLYMFGKTTRVAPKRSRKLLRPHPPTSPRVSPKSCEDLSEIENKSCAQKRPSRPQRADQNPGETNTSNIRASNSTRSAPFPPSRIRSRALTRAHFFLQTGFSREKAKKKESKRVPCASLKLLPLMFIAVSRMFLKCTLKSVPRALHDFVASLDSRAYLTIV